MQRVLSNKAVKFQIKIPNGCWENSENFRGPLFLPHPVGIKSPDIDVDGGWWSSVWQWLCTSVCRVQIIWQWHGRWPKELCSILMYVRKAKRMSSVSDAVSGLATRFVCNELITRLSVCYIVCVCLMVWRHTGVFSLGCRLWNYVCLSVSLFSIWDTVSGLEIRSTSLSLFLPLFANLSDCLTVWCSDWQWGLLTYLSVTY